MSGHIDEFAKKLIELVRDEAIRTCDSGFLPSINSPRSLKWKALAEKGDTAELTRTIIPDCIDTVIQQLLGVIERGEFKLIYKADDESLVDLEVEGEGEMLGWYSGGGGESWCDLYSSERVNDYLADLPTLDWD